MKAYTASIGPFAGASGFNCAMRLHVVVVLVVLGVCPNDVAAQVCLRVPDALLSETVHKCEHCVLAKWVKTTVPSENSPGMTTYRVVRTLKSKGSLFTPGTAIEIADHISAKTGEVHTLISRKLASGWNSPLPGNDALWSYINRLLSIPSMEENSSERVTFFLTCLQDDDAAVAADAFGEMVKADYSVLRSLRDQLPREKIRSWILDPETPVTRLRLYGLMLGLCGHDEDAEALKRLITEQTAGFRPGLDGCMIGYLLLCGEEALDVLDQYKIEPAVFINSEGHETPVPFSETYAAMMALRFMWKEEPDYIPAQRLKESMRILLARPELADLVMADLARWKDWEVREQLMQMYFSKDFDIPTNKRAILRYLHACSKDVPGIGEPPEHAVDAEKCLQILKKKDPATFREAMRFVVK